MSPLQHRCATLSMTKQHRNSLLNHWVHHVIYIIIKHNILLHCRLHYTVTSFEFVATSIDFWQLEVSIQRNSNRTMIITARDHWIWWLYEINHVVHVFSNGLMHCLFIVQWCCNGFSIEVSSQFYSKFASNSYKMISVCLAMTDGTKQWFVIVDNGLQRFRGTKMIFA